MYLYVCIDVCAHACLCDSVCACMSVCVQGNESPTGISYGKGLGQGLLLCLLSLLFSRRRCASSHQNPHLC